jgi:hypothetical protein
MSGDEQAWLSIPGTHSEKSSPSALYSKYPRTLTFEMLIFFSPAEVDPSTLLPAKRRERKRQQIMSLVEREGD